MQAKLTTEEIFGLLMNRFYDYSTSKTIGCWEEHNATVDILKDFVESFSEGRLQIVAASQAISGNISVEGTTTKNNH